MGEEKKKYKYLGTHREGTKACASMLMGQWVMEIQLKNFYFYNIVYGGNNHNQIIWIL